MRSSTRTIKHTHTPIHIPSLEDVKAWAKQTLNSETRKDAALLAISVGLFGWVFFCLAKAFQNVQVLM